MSLLALPLPLAHPFPVGDGVDEGIQIRVGQIPSDARKALWNRFIRWRSFNGDGIGRDVGSPGGLLTMMQSLLPLFLTHDPLRILRYE